MADALSRTVHFKDARFAGWLLLAVLGHASLLLIPARQGLPPGEALHSLVVSLQRSARTQRPDPEFTLPERSPPPTAVPSEDTVTPAETKPEPPAPHSPPATQDNLPPALSTAHLLELASRQAWSRESSPGTRDLGAFRPRPLPDNWQRGMPPQANRFAGMMAPDEAEVVDRWLAADGSHNVVVNTPSGDTYCGRAEAWTPLNPLFEPVMTWRPCGGGGQRSFEMPERYAKPSGERDPRR